VQTGRRRGRAVLGHGVRGRGSSRQPASGDGGRVVRRVPARLHPARRDAAHGQVPGRVRRAAVHAQRVPHEDVRQPLHHGHRHASRDARRVGQFHVRPAQQEDALHVRAVPLRRVGGADLGKLRAPPTICAM